jgi:NADPH-dependent ferric siderophore reductase
MTDTHSFELSGIAHPLNVEAMLDEICEHFVEHSEVSRLKDKAVLTSSQSLIELFQKPDHLEIRLACGSEEELEATRTMFAEHLYYFAGEEPFSLDWSKPAPRVRPANLQEAVVISTSEVTPRMLRVTLAPEDMTPFINGDIHVRLLVPQAKRPPVWPKLRTDGRIDWPKGEDKLLVRVYTIRSVDADKGQITLDIFQHPAEGISTPGADFARDALQGTRIGIMGPGGGGLPQTDQILFAGDESALPAIARMIEEASPETKIKAIIEVEDKAEEQPISSKACISIEWLHRASCSEGTTNLLAERTKAAIDSMEAGTFVWFAAERSIMRNVKAYLAARGHDRKRQYVAWYWEEGKHADD